jgi:hypothetical protein
VNGEAAAAGGGASDINNINNNNRPAAPGRALTEEGEHDDPILKNLTGMGYARGDALAALEKYDYNLERVSTTTTIPTKPAVSVSVGAVGVGAPGTRLGKEGFGGAFSSLR